MSRFSRLVLALVLGFSLGACAGGDGTEADGSDWQHTRTTEGDLTIVETTAGSVWGGEAHVSEELSIGELEGADEYAFAFISEIWVTDDQVLVADGQLPAVRVYDHAGNFVRDIGRPGQGPGEYERGIGVMVLPDGRIAVYDGVKLLVYEADGTFIEHWGSASQGGFRFVGPDMTAMGDDGTIYIRTPIIPEDRSGFVGMGSLRWGMKPWAPDGTEGELIEAPDLGYDRPTVEISVGGGRAAMPVPFSPDAVWTMLPDGSFAAGVSDTYAFTIYRTDGTRLEIRKHHEPVPVNPDEVKLQQSSMRVVINGQSPAVDWSEVESPDFKPAYDAFVPTRDGRIMVLRAGPTTVDPACLEPGITSRDIQAMDCTDGVSWADVFEADGTFLGTFTVPDGVRLQAGAFIDGDTVWASAQDELGAVMVKKLRIVPPGDMPPT